MKKYLEIYNDKKLSEDNAWSTPLIDTLTTLLDNHHNSLNNFKMAGCWLEASSKVYGLRVDSVHRDSQRISASLNAHTFSNRAMEQDYDDDISEIGTQPNEENKDGTAQAPVATASTTKAAKSKRTQKQVSTVSKNKETLNACLDTVPLTDPVFAKHNSIIGSVNSVNRLLNNILPSIDSEVRLRLDFPFWDGSTIEAIDYTADFNCTDEPTTICEKLIDIEFGELKLRPMTFGYAISDTLEDIDDNVEKDSRSESPTTAGFGEDLNHEMSMAFDIDADVEPIPLTGQTAPMADVNFRDYEELTRDGRAGIHQCKGLRKAADRIEDLRPVDSSSKLEYSYQPLDKISQFWAGPSHWKFKKGRPRSSVMGPQQRQSQQQPDKPQGRRGRQKQRQSKYVNFGEFHDDLFIKLDDKFKSRKTNIHNWDARTLKLPTDLQVDRNMFKKFRFAPGIPVEEDKAESHAPDLHTERTYDELGADEPGYIDEGDGFDAINGGGAMNTTHHGDVEAEGDTTILEIPTDFDGALSPVKKFFLPFAKRAKVIDMRKLKKSCKQLLEHQVRKAVVEKIPDLPIPKEEQYAPGVASFQDIYSHLPEVLSPSMIGTVSLSVAFYSILELAGDLNLRLVPQTDLNDFMIRKVLE